MTFYFDSSAVTKLFVTEPESEAVRALWEAGQPVISSWITYAETSAAIAAARRARRLSSGSMRNALRLLNLEWRAVFAVDVDERAALVAGSLAVRHGLRGMDALHLAAALLVAEARPVVVTWDAELRRAAAAEGLAVAL